MTTTDTTSATDTIDPSALEAFMGQMVGYMTGTAVCFGVWLGDQLGLYREMAGAGPVSADDLAERADCHPRLVREWLDGQTAAGILQRDAAADTYLLPAEQAMALADDTSAVFVARAMRSFGAMYKDFETTVDTFRGDGGMPWGAHHSCLFTGTEWFFRTGYRAYLPTDWLPTLDGVAERLEAGGRVADVGCGHGASIVAMASAFPKARYTAIDIHAPSIDVARERIAEAGVTADVDYEVASATGYSGTYDLICFFDCLHDMGDPVAAARYARDHLAEDGTILLVEPNALDGRDANIGGNPLAAMMYHASAAICVPNSLSQETGAGLGAQAGEAALRRVFEDAGFTRFRRATETPMNLIIEVRP